VRDGGGRVGLRIYESLKPVIAAINGAAVGVGATMTLPMDIRMAVEGAKMGFVFARRGIVPETLSSYFLPRLVGVQTALEWTMTGRVFSSEEAHARGLVRSLHKPDDLLPAAQALAREIADNTAPVSVALTRRMLLDMLDAGHPMEAHRLESRLMVARGKAGDAKEGVTSFLEKRAPVYPDKVSKDLPQPFPWRPAPPFREQASVWPLERFSPPPRAEGRFRFGFRFGFRAVIVTHHEERAGPAGVDPNPFDAGEGVVGFALVADGEVRLRFGVVELRERHLGADAYALDLGGEDRGAQPRPLQIGLLRLADEGAAALLNAGAEHDFRIRGVRIAKRAAPAAGQRSAALGHVTPPCPSRDPCCRRPRRGSLRW